MPNRRRKKNNKSESAADTGTAQGSDSNEDRQKKGGDRPGSASSKEGQPSGRTLLDEKVNELLRVEWECDNGSQTRAQILQEELLVNYLKRNAQELYPNLGQVTYRVPEMHMNKPKAEKQTKAQAAEVKDYQEFDPPDEATSRGDRAHAFVLKVIHQLSLSYETSRKDADHPPMFIITSYEYDNFLSRLKSECGPQLESEVERHRPAQSGRKRGEVDTLIFYKDLVLLVQVKAMGDNFSEYSEKDKGNIPLKILSTVKKTVSDQLDRDEKVFKHIMSDLTNLEAFTMVKIAAFPNLTRQAIVEAFQKNPETVKEYKLPPLEDLEKKYVLLCKDDLPLPTFAGEKDLEYFSAWWENNVQVQSKLQVQPGDTGQVNTPAKRVRTLSSSENAVVEEEKDSSNSVLDTVMTMVGRYLGFMSRVEIRRNANTSYHRVEVRRRGQAIVVVGDKFSEIILTSKQVDYVNNNERLGYLCGPPGSGKTVVLAMRAKRLLMDTSFRAVVVNMYRGAPGRAIGKQMYLTITDNSDPDMNKRLKQQCMEIPVDVMNFDREHFVRSVKKQWPETFQEGDVADRKLLFLVDETYVEEYWAPVFNTLVEEFPNAHMWCAGLYGAAPKNFTSMQLEKVIRCPPKVQEVLKLIDWNEDRKKCYVLDSTKEGLTTNGLDVLSVRHRFHRNAAQLQPHLCRECGDDLADILEQMNVRKPGVKDSQPDLQVCSLTCNDILILVNLARSCYRTEKKGGKEQKVQYLETNEDEYKKCMEQFRDCPMFNQLSQRGYPVHVHDELPCSSLMEEGAESERINVTWGFSFQGLERKFIMFMGGDPAMPSQECLDAMSEEKRDIYVNPMKNIPCPGLGKKLPEEDWTGNFLVDTNPVRFIDFGGKVDEEETEGKEPVLPPQRRCKTLADMSFRKEDLDRLTRWDKNNLFISASRCTAQLVLLIP